MDDITTADVILAWLDTRHEGVSPGLNDHGDPTMNLDAEALANFTLFIWEAASGSLASQMLTQAVDSNGVFDALKEAAEFMDVNYYVDDSGDNRMGLKAQQFADLVTLACTITKFSKDD